MIRIRIIILLILVAIAIGVHEHGGAAPTDPGHKPILGYKSDILVTFDVNKVPGYVFNPSFTGVLKSHTEPDGWHVVPSNTVFDDSLPKFKAMISDPSRKADDWIVISKDGKVLDSEPLPADEKKATKIVTGSAR